MCSGVVVLAGVLGFAQALGSPQQPGMPQQPQQSTTPAVGAPGPYPATAPTGQDFGEKAFVAKALEGDQSEMQLGQLALQKSQSNDVKQLAQKLASDHTQMDEKWFKPVAKQLGVSEPKGPSKRVKKVVAKLEGLSGPDFDTQYLTIMLKDHQQDLKEFKDEANSAQDPNVKQVAEQGANIIAKNHNVAVDEKQKLSM